MFDRSAPLPTGGHLEQADGTAWVSLFCQNMLEISMELATHDLHEDMAMKFADHFLWIARAMNQAGPDGMWDEEDGFYYDVLRLPDGKATRLKVRSMVGLPYLCHHSHRALAAPTGTASGADSAGTVATHARTAREHASNRAWSSWACRSRHHAAGQSAAVAPDLSRMLDERILSPYGIRAISRYAPSILTSSMWTARNIE